MSPALRRELCAYRLCRLDDTVSESPHRDVSLIAARAPASRIPWWSASVRLKQNLRMAGDPRFRQVFASVWADWKLLAAAPTRTRRRAPRLKTKPFLDAVHRVGSFGLADCSNIGKGHRDLFVQALKAREAALPMSAKVWRDLRREFVRAVVSDGKVFTAQLACAPPSALEMASQCLPSASRQQQQHFRVLDCAVGHKKHNLTTRWVQVKSMAMPMSIQKLSAVAVDSDHQEPVQDVAQDRTLIPDGVPEVIDFLSFVPWEVVRCSLQEWSSVAVRPASTLAGCGALHVSNPVVASARPWVFADEGTPMVVLVDALLAQGWRAARTLADSPRSHSTGADHRGKLFFIKRLQLQWKPYFQCLLSLPDLAAKGLVELPARQKPAFYSAVLASSEPGAVPQDLGVAAYRKMCEDRGPVLKRDDDVSDSPLQGHVAGHGLARRGPVFAEEDAEDAPLQPVPVGSAPPQRRRSELGEEAYAGLWNPDELLRRSPSASSSSSSTPSASGAARSGGSGGQPEQRPARQKRKRPRGMHADGVSVVVEDRVGACRRVIITCPWHAHCKRTRNTAAAQCKNFGEREPLWFLGAWLHGGRSRDRDGHKRFTPSVKDVREFRDRGAWNYDDGESGAAATGGGAGAA